MENKNPRQFVDSAYTRETFLKVYSHFLVPIGGPVVWPKDTCNEILPPYVRVLPGRPKKGRRIDPSELRERAERAAAEKEEKRLQKKRKQSVQKKGAVEVAKISRKGQANHCKACGTQGHNIRSCPFKNIGEGSSQAPAEGSSMPSRESMSQPPGEPATARDGPPRKRNSSSQPEARRQKRARHV